MEAYEGGHDDTPADLRLLREQKASIEADEQAKKRERLENDERDRLRREIKAKGHKPCA